MCRRATIRLFAASIGSCVAGLVRLAQTTGLDWRHIGNSAIDLRLPSVATGPVDRVWYSTRWIRFYMRARHPAGLSRPSNFEQWQRGSGIEDFPPDA